jgi:SAM-dependent methyltransferase
MNSSPLNRLVLSREALLVAYDVVSTVYPYIPPVSLWRAWEYAAYQHYSLNGRVLDLGCGDGRFFRLVWPKATEVVGVDMDPSIAEIGLKGGAYRKVHAVHARQVPEPDSSFDHVFANCSLEHMDHLDAVLAEIHRCLRPGGTLLCSVVTDRFLKWSLLHNLMAVAGFEDTSKSLKADFVEYHHLVNPLSVGEWVNRFGEACMICEEHVPILPKCNTAVFLLMDTLWHLKKAGGGEMGDLIFQFLSSANAAIQGAFRKFFSGLLEMETDWEDCGGAVFSVRKSR